MITSHQKPKRPWSVNVMNWAGRSFKLQPQFSAQHLIGQAEEQVGFDQWRSPQPGFDLKTALDILVESLNQEAHLDLVGHRFFQEFLQRLLTNHLTLQQEYQRYPEILQVPLDRPLFVVGLFRSGTTFLHNLLSQTPNSRWLSVTEALFPTPAPRPDTWAVDPRVAQAIKHIRFQESLAPNFSTAHHIDPQRPAECSRLFEHDLVAHLFDFRAEIPRYSHWLYSQNLRGAYQSYRQQLQYLSWQWPGQPWVLKAPAHIFALDDLLSVFPDAAIVYLHRDPMTVLPSCCSLASLGRQRFSAQVNPHQIGSHWLNCLGDGVDRALAVRHTLSQQFPQATPLYELSYRSLLGDPLGSIQAIFKHFGYDWSEDLNQNLSHWIAANPQHKHGVHRYSLEDFGLTATQIHDRFSAYYDRFQDLL